MSSTIKTYDGKKVKIIVGGFPISGVADNTFVKIERDEDTFMKKIGAYGEASRSKNNNRSGTATITLLQTSPSNDILSALALTDELTNTGIVPFLVQDLSGTSTFVSATAWIKRPASSEFGKEISNREWNFELIDMDVFVGGNL